MLQCLLAVPSMAQFYPEAQACWDGVDDDGGPPDYQVGFRMGLTPDTLINGTAYKKIDEYRHSEFTRSYFVRSDPSGKGYAYLPDSAAEFLTGDITAQAGDTVYDVLWSLTSANDIFYSLQNTVVDSVVVLTNAGVTVTRHYVNNNGSLGFYRFWQAGMGASYGPMLEATGNAWGCSVGDTAMFGCLADGLLPGPIGECTCSVPGNGINDHIRPQEIQVLPNPSTGLFQFTGIFPTAIHILDTQGRTLFTTNKPEVDLSAYPVGCYRAVVVSESGKSSLPLVVVR